MNKKNIFITFVLIFIWVIFSFIYSINSDNSVRTLSYNHTIANENSFIYKNHPYVFNLKADSDNLGTIVIPFTTKDDSLNDVITIKIKQLGDKQWYYQSKYIFKEATGSIDYPIGFPIIENSKNKIYEIRLESNSKNKIAPLFIDKKRNLVTKYSFNPLSFIQSPSNILFFTHEKINYALKNYNLLNAVIFYSLPLLFYILYLLFEEKIKGISYSKVIYSEIAKFNKPLIWANLISIIVYIFLYTKNSDLIITLISFFWIINIIKFKYMSKTSFIFALIFLVLCPILLIFKMDKIAERSAVWAFMFLLIGTLQVLLEENSKTISRFNKNIYIKGIIDIIVSIYNVLVRLPLYLIIFPYTFFFKSKTKSKDDGKPHAIKSIILTIIMLAIFILLYLGNYYLNKAIIRQKINPIITSVQPQLVYRPTKVVIYGKEFGWQPEGSKLMSQYGEVNTIYWSDTKVIFNIPFEWKDGNINLYIQKQKEFYGQNLILKSKTSKIKLLPSHSFFTPDDDAFFKAVPSLPEEVRKINGYE